MDDEAGDQQDRPLLQFSLDDAALRHRSLCVDGERAMRVRDVMSTRPVSIGSEHSVWHAAQIMLTEHVSALPVLNDGEALVGVVTEGDLLRRSELGTPLGTEWHKSAPGHMSRAGAGRSARSRHPRSWRSRRMSRCPRSRCCSAFIGSSACRCCAARNWWRSSAGRTSSRLFRRADQMPRSGAKKTVLRGLRARLAEAGSVLSRQPELHVEGGRVRVTGAMRSQPELDIERMVVDRVVGSQFKDELTVEKEHE